MSRPGQLAHGRSPGDVVRQFVDRFQEIDRRLRENAAMATKAIVAANNAIPIVQVTQIDSDVAWTTPTSWTVRASHDFVVPAGFTTAYVTAFAATGATFDDASGFALIGAGAVIAGATGPQITNGATYSTSQALSVSSFQAYNVTGLSGGDTVTVQCLGYRQYGISGNENAHLSAQVIFYR